MASNDANAALWKLEDACKRHNIQQVQSVLGDKTLLEALNDDESKAFKVLQSAVESGHSDTVTFLLKRGADRVLVNPTDTIIGSAIEAACISGHTHIIRLLIEHGASVHQRYWNDQSLLHGAASSDRVDVMQFLIDAGVDVKAKNSRGSTPLHHACREGNLAAVQLLLEAGADVNVIDEDVGTPLHEAAENGHVTVMALLVRHGADPNIVSETGKTALHHAAVAAKDEQAAAVQFLIEQEVDVNLPDEDGKTALHYTGARRHLNAAAILLANGADTEIRDFEYGSTALHDACNTSEVTDEDTFPVVKMLLQHAADVMALDKEGNSPLGLAIWCEEGDGELEPNVYGESSSDEDGNRTPASEDERDDNASHDAMGEDDQAMRHRVGEGDDHGADRPDHREPGPSTASESKLPKCVRNTCDLCVYHGADIFYKWDVDSRNYTPCLFHRSRQTAHKWIKMHNQWLTKHQWETDDVTRVQTALMALMSSPVGDPDSKMISALLQLTVFDRDLNRDAKAWPLLIKWFHRMLVNNHRAVLDSAYKFMEA